MCTYTTQRSQRRFWPVLGLSRLLISSYFLVKIKYKTQFDKCYQIQSSFILWLARCRCLIKTQKVLVSKCLYWKKMVKNLKCVVLLCPKIAGILFSIHYLEIFCFLLFSWQKKHTFYTTKIETWQVDFHVFFTYCTHQTANICL